MTLLTAREAAQILRISLRTLRDRRFRQRLGLSTVYVNKRLRFLPSDLEKVIKRHDA